MGTTPSKSSHGPRKQKRLFLTLPPVFSRYIPFNLWQSIADVVSSLDIQFAKSPSGKLLSLGQNETVATRLGRHGDAPVVVKFIKSLENASSAPIIKSKRARLLVGGQKDASKGELTSSSNSATSRPILSDSLRESITKLMSLKDDNVVPILAANEAENWIMTKFIAGTTLEELLANKDPRILWENNGLDIMDKLLRVIKRLHAQGIHHGKLSPASVLITFDNQVQLFGFRVIDEAGSLLALAKGQPPLKNNYISSIYFCKNANTNDQLNDIHAICVMLWEVWTNQLATSAKLSRHDFLKALPPSVSKMAQYIMPFFFNADPDVPSLDRLLDMIKASHLSKALSEPPSTGLSLLKDFQSSKDRTWASKYSGAFATLLAEIETSLALFNSSGSLQKLLWCIEILQILRAQIVAWVSVYMDRAKETKTRSQDAYCTILRLLTPPENQSQSYLFKFFSVTKTVVMRVLSIQRQWQMSDAALANFSLVQAPNAPFFFISVDPEKAKLHPTSKDALKASLFAAARNLAKFFQTALEPLKGAPLSSEEKILLGEAERDESELKKTLLDAFRDVLVSQAELRPRLYASATAFCDTRPIHNIFQATSEFFYEWRDDFGLLNERLIREIISAGQGELPDHSMAPEALEMDRLEAKKHLFFLWRGLHSRLGAAAATQQQALVGVQFVGRQLFAAGLFPASYQLYSELLQGCQLLGRTDDSLLCLAAESVRALSSASPPSADVSLRETTFHWRADRHLIRNLRDISAAHLRMLKLNGITISSAFDVASLHYQSSNMAYFASSMEEYLKRVISDCEILMGMAPCQFCIMSLGSIASRQATPYSDVELMLLVDADSDCRWYTSTQNLGSSTLQARSWLQSFFSLLELRIESLGESSHESPKTHMKIGVESHQGIKIDQSASFFQDDLDRDESLAILMGSPETIVDVCIRTAQQNAKDDKNRGLCLSVITKSRFLYGNQSLALRMHRQFLLRHTSVGFVSDHRLSLRTKYSHYYLFESRKTSIPLRNLVLEDVKNIVRKFDARVAPLFSNTSSTRSLPLSVLQKNESYDFKHDFLQFLQLSAQCIALWEKDSVGFDDALTGQNALKCLLSAGVINKRDLEVLNQADLLLQLTRQVTSTRHADFQRLPSALRYGIDLIMWACLHPLSTMMTNWAKTSAFSFESSDAKGFPLSQLHARTILDELSEPFETSDSSKRWFSLLTWFCLSKDTPKRLYEAITANPATVQPASLELGCRIIQKCIESKLMGAWSAKLEELSSMLKSFTSVNGETAAFRLGEQHWLECIATHFLQGKSPLSRSESSQSNVWVAIAKPHRTAVQMKITEVKAGQELSSLVGSIEAQITFPESGESSVLTTFPPYTKLRLRSKPEATSVEAAANRLIRLIAGYEAAPFADLWALRREKQSVSQRFPVLVLTDVKGQTLQEELLHESGTVQALDFSAFCRLVLATILTNPRNGDAKGYYVTRDNPSGKARLVALNVGPFFVDSIDAFDEAASKTIDIKTILYCMDEMLEPVHSDTLEFLERISPVKTILDWLKGHQEHDHRFEILLPSQGGLQLKLNTLHQLVDKLLRMQKVVLEFKYGKVPATKPVTLFDLLRAAEPVVANVYEGVMLTSKALPPLARFNKIVFGTPNFRKVSPPAFGGSLFSDVVGASTAQDRAAFLDLNQLIDGCKGIQEHLETLEPLVSEFASNQFDSFKSITMAPSTREAIVWKTNWNYDGFQSSAALKLILDVGCEFSRLQLRFFPIETDTPLLKKALKAMSNLTWLDLTACEAVDDTIPPIIGEFCSALSILSLSKCRKLTKVGGKVKLAGNSPLKLRKLARLDLSGCSRLAEVKLATPKLVYLNITDTPLPLDTIESYLTANKGSSPQIERGLSSMTTEQPSKEERKAFEYSHPWKGFLPSKSVVELYEIPLIDSAIVERRSQPFLVSAVAWACDCLIQGDTELCVRLKMPVKAAEQDLYCRLVFRDCPSISRLRGIGFPVSREDPSIYIYLDYCAITSHKEQVATGSNSLEYLGFRLIYGLALALRYLATKNATITYSVLHQNIYWDSRGYPTILDLSSFEQLDQNSSGRQLFGRSESKYPTSLMAPETKKGILTEQSISWSWAAFALVSLSRNAPYSTVFPSPDDLKRAPENYSKYIAEIPQPLAAFLSKILDATDHTTRPSLGDIVSYLETTYPEHVGRYASGMPSRLPVWKKKPMRLPRPVRLDNASRLFSIGEENESMHKISISRTGEGRDVILRRVTQPNLNLCGLVAESKVAPSPFLRRHIALYVLLDEVTSHTTREIEIVALKAAAGQPLDQFLSKLLCSSAVSPFTYILISERNLFKILYNIARALAHLHSAGVVHRDLISRQVNIDSECNVTLECDDFARYVGQSLQGEAESKVGPVRSMAPENFDLKFSQFSDVWSYGCFVAEVVTARVLYPAMTSFPDIAAAIRVGKLDPASYLRPLLGSGVVPNYIVKLFSFIFVDQAPARPTAAEVVEFLAQNAPSTCKDLVNS